jgi:ribosomal-protein-alanine N-acetyltransferase
MTPNEAARVHAAAFAPDRGWSAAEISDLIASSHVTLHAEDEAFALVRSVGGEAELLTLAVAPRAQRQGRGRRLLQRWLATETATEVFLEVAADNTPAIALYRDLGFAVISERKAYYARPQGPAVDALLMRCTLTLGQRPR